MSHVCVFGGNSDFTKSSQNPQNDPKPKTQLYRPYPEYIYMIYIYILYIYTCACSIIWIWINHPLMKIYQKIWSKTWEKNKTPYQKSQIVCTISVKIWPLDAIPWCFMLPNEQQKHQMSHENQKNTKNSVSLFYLIGQICFFEFPPGLCKIALVSESR